MRNTILFPDTNSHPISITVVNKFDKEKDFSIFGSEFSSFESLSEKYLDQAEISSSVETVPYSFIQKHILNNEYHIGYMHIHAIGVDVEYLQNLNLTFTSKNIKGMEVATPFKAGLQFSAFQYQLGVLEVSHPFTIKGSSMISGKIPAKSRITFAFFPDELYEIRKVNHSFASILIDKIYEVAKLYQYSLVHGQRPELIPSMAKTSSLPIGISTTIRKFKHNSIDVFHSMADIFCDLTKLKEDYLELKAAQELDRQQRLELRLQREKYEQEKTLADKELADVKAKELAKKKKEKINKLKLKPSAKKVKVRKKKVRSTKKTKNKKPDIKYSITDGKNNTTIKKVVSTKTSVHGKKKLTNDPGKKSTKKTKTKKKK